MHLSLKKTKVACRPRLYLQTPAVPGVPESVEQAVELHGPWEGEVQVLTDHTGTTQLAITLAPLAPSSTVALDYGEPTAAMRS